MCKDEQDKMTLPVDGDVSCELRPCNYFGALSSDFRWGGMCGAPSEEGKDRCALHLNVKNHTVLINR